MTAGLVHDDRSTDASWVVLDDVGRAGFAAITVLARILRRDARDVAALILSAPSALVGPLAPEAAADIADTLRRTGLTTRAVDATAPVEKGDDGHEIAVTVTDYARMNGVVIAVCELLGCQPRDAAALLCRTPAVVLGGLSAANVAVLRDRFAALGAELDASRRDTARYEVVATADGAEAHAAIARAARASGVGLTLMDDGVTYFAAELEREHATRLTEGLAAAGVPVRALDEAFQRFDVVLDQAPSRARRSVAAVIADHGDVPAHAADRVAGSAPVVVARQRRRGEVAALLAPLHDAGARAHAEMTSGLQFDLEVLEVSDGEAASRAVEEIGRVSRVQSASLRSGRPGRVDGPFTYNQIRWLRAELASAGCRTRTRRRR